MTTKDNGGRKPGFDLAEMRKLTAQLKGLYGRLDQLTENLKRAKWKGAYHVLGGANIYLSIAWIDQCVSKLEQQHNAEHELGLTPSETLDKPPRLHKANTRKGS